MDQSADSVPQILLVDDEPLILSSYGRTLRTLNVEVLLADGPDEGLRMLEKQPVNVVIADYRMPGMNGDEFLEHVRKRWPETVRMLNTAYADVEIVEDVVKRGEIFRFLTKPCDADKLKAAVLDALDYHRLLREKKKRSKKQQLDLQNFRKIFDSALDPMMVSDLEGNLVEVNEAFLRQLGSDRESALEQRPTIMSYWGQESLWPSIREMLSKVGHWSDELHHKSDNRYALMSISVVNDDQGKPYALVALEKDVTARRRLEQESRAAQYEVILALAKLAEYRDPETFAHLERMRRYSRILTLTLGNLSKYAEVIDEAFVEAVFASSPLHDVGKVGIPDSVLLKPGRLSAEEWKIMQLHTRIGGEILSAAGRSLSQKSWLSMAMNIALQHHEKYDGSGYPQGLRGESIDLAARIVALADAYDAITSKRVYKEATIHDDARQRILKDSGTHFDPDVVQAFIRSEEEFLQVREQYSEEESITLDAKLPVDVLNRIERLLASSQRGNKDG